MSVDTITTPTTRATTFGPQCGLTGRGNRQSAERSGASGALRALDALTWRASTSPARPATSWRRDSTVTSRQSPTPATAAGEALNTISGNASQPWRRAAAPSPVSSGPWPKRAISPPSSPKGNSSKTIDWSKARSGAPLPSKPSKPDLSDVRPGMVFFLGVRPVDLSAASQYVRDLASLKAKSGQDVFNHPVVVLEKNTPNESVKFRLCTTFGGKNEIPANKSPVSRSKIALCDSHNTTAEEHDGTCRLTMERGSEVFSKATWINFAGYETSEFLIDYASLELWKTNSGRMITFDGESIRRIKACSPY